MVDLKKHGPTIALLFTMLVMLSYGIEGVRVTVGTMMNVLLGPFIDVLGVPFFVMIMILSSITGLYSSLVQKYTIDYEKMQETQAKMRVFQKEFREAQLSGDEKRVKKLQGKQERMMQDQLDMSRQQFTPMAIILILSVPIFFWLLLRLPAVGTPIDIASGIVMPFIGTVTLSSIAFWIVPAWILWYMLCSLTISQVIRKALNIGGL
ncbi:MAG: hypothetical protein BWX50_00644 [Euryarchaeota archaeon ADurb.Bin009]|jgi:uncharacterized membrane protein (DUF106 family)|uniref:DUF106 domain-containing protein n=1 Tax=Methanoculleus sp. TaxID=90427 RepID=UPI0009C6D776|nr:EMC3/TMCO1 family protein [Methanoculleus sp.]OQC71065.1 MAG: hypothetical protein BWX50_00644 [Euryarchaeota archaeon ADurb.Bin009]MBP7145131.1 DUF106 domain-containing protein [Methanoculleus sp.]HNQ33186.1 EMC3/TMCO1 family protein [Methanoculleus sp.]HNT07031.1 EMC3/TMCO1 family protein [Methanoculleus sp.]HNV37579.1 EMC3/TMCO1 family protein [Methanoculleus sp.]